MLQVQRVHVHSLCETSKMCRVTCTVIDQDLRTHYTPDQEVDDFAVAQSTPLPEYIAGIEGDKV